MEGLSFLEGEVCRTSAIIQKKRKIFPIHDIGPSRRAHRQTDRQTHTHTLQIQAKMQLLINAKEQANQWVI